ncbi:MAG: bifunctional (p)ppGpp synthetase/guanosine-3',5'-bis(diphosphate) 3'-pyrophosphohydrolase [Candidatus Aminicenantes bacterium]|nr:bifunctional (p)ppGpp synthetase/guanosine-3',5'-bis(diphosphate) 3'-pyrophosphohydrolase [Candidatus Aminicenantes bacterium]
MKMIKRFHELQEKILSYYPEANIALLKKAYAVSTDAHLNQKRASNEPYITHPLTVAGILADMKVDEISIAAALLHDVIEDSQYSREDLNRLFGSEISDIVWGVTKISKISEVDVEDAQAETLKKMIIAMTADVRVILIKLADRLHNIRTLAHLPPERQIKIARETLEIYAPIAYRLGMGKIRDELEDVSFTVLHPEEYRRIKSEVSDKYELAMKQVENLKKQILHILKNAKIKAEIHYRIKREISIYRKLQKQNIELENVYDLLALRVITDTVANCYVIMGAIHQQWVHIPGRWRDFITNPKSNFYQSIHTTIITREGVKFEIQIRTREMHRNAEEGIAAHWKYKEGLAFLENDHRLEWFREMIDYHKTNPDPKEFLSLVKRDLTPNEIYVFTPKGKVVNLKAGSSPIDFAYAIHSEVGDHCKNAIVNEKLVPLRTKLNSGDVVEIITQKNSSPSADWLKFAMTTRARKRIMTHLQKEEFAYAHEKGRRLWQKVVREYQKKYRLKFDEEEMQKRVNAAGYPDMESFLRDIGGGRKTLNKLTLKKLFPEVGAVEIKPVKRAAARTSSLHSLVHVDGQPDIDFIFAKCCHPIKGEEIIGYITKNRGLVVHRKTCANVNMEITSRLKHVTWNDAYEHAYQVKLELLVADKPGVLSAITGITAASNSNIKKLEQEQTSQDMVKITLIFEVRDMFQLNEIYSQLKKVPDIYSINRKKTADR